MNQLLSNHITTLGIVFLSIDLENSLTYPTAGHDDNSFIFVKYENNPSFDVTADNTRWKVKSLTVDGVCPEAISGTHT